MAYEPFDSRNHCLVFYGTEEQLMLSLTNHYNRILHYAYILHDLDPTDPHWHIALHLNNTVNSDKVIAWFKEFNEGQNVMDEEEGNKVKFFKYLTHTGKDNKTQYSIQDIVCDDLNYFLDKNATAYNIVCDLMAGAPIRYMAQTYGRDFILNIDKYQRFADRMSTDDYHHDFERYEKLLPPD